MPENWVGREQGCAAATSMAEDVGFLVMLGRLADWMVGARVHWQLDGWRARMFGPAWWAAWHVRWGLGPPQSNGGSSRRHALPCMLAHCRTRLQTTKNLFQVLLREMVFEGV